ncbi:hypothetical protein [Tepidibacter thalassicus]|uniref:Uncharacterized protein n=1 Tax=Tepidibacter thalassicus DSM 15285 TaxID=1123350 RepID=A0A1M5PXW8_9FIRM|nr:hypothetical protein [Tepidibacter thalassicus]SHH06530.1 hypothetical protein SAMN02744040_00665 [Tepidibacter thalassicus DSM 15285]
MNNELLTTLRQLLKEELEPIKSQINENTQLLSELKTKINNLEQGQFNLESKLDTVSNKLDDFETKNAQRHIEIIDKLNSDIEFIKHKEFKNEEDIFKLKKNLQIIK